MFGDVAGETQFVQPLHHHDDGRLFGPLVTVTAKTLLNIAPGIGRVVLHGMEVLMEEAVRCIDRSLPSRPRPMARQESSTMSYPCKEAVILAMAVCSAALTAPAGLDAETAWSENTTAEELYRQFRREYPDKVQECFPDIDPAAGPGPLAADQHQRPEWLRAVIVLDASGSMAGKVGNETKMQAAVSAVGRFLKSLPEESEVGLVVFGHEGSNDESGKTVSCQAVTTMVPPAAGKAGSVEDVLQQVQPTGWTPLARAITAAGAALRFDAGEGEQVVFVVSDGDETCGGDPVAAARDVHESGARAIVNIIGLDLLPADRRELTKVAETGGGVYMDAVDSDGVLEAMRQQAAWRQARFDHEVAARRATNANSTDAFVARSEAQSCVADIRNSEYAAVSQRVKGLRADGRVPSEVFMAFRQMVLSDHDAHKEMLEEYRNSLDAAVDRTNEEIRDKIVEPGRGN